MSEKQPTLSISRPVVGIHEADINHLRDGLAHVDADGATGLKDLFHPAEGLRAAIISPGELQILYARLGRTPSVQEITELGEYVRQGLAAASGGEADPIPVLPSEIQSPKTKGRRKVLTVAASETIVVERLIAQNAVRNFLKLEQIPPRVWLNDKYVARPHLAHGSSAKEVALLGLLEGLLNANDKKFTLPKYVQIKPVNIAILSKSRSTPERHK